MGLTSGRGHRQQRLVKDGNNQAPEYQWSYKRSPEIWEWDLSWPCHKIGQGHPRVMVYINFVELHSLMLHAKFQNHRPSGSDEEDF